MKVTAILALSDAYTAIIHGVEPIVPAQLNYRDDLLADIARPTPKTADKLEQAIRSLYRQLCLAESAKLKRQTLSTDTLALFEFEDVLQQLVSSRYAALARGHRQRAVVLDRVYTRLKHAPRPPHHDAVPTH
ncbi:hypothetical protein [Methylomonas rhizoryzae]|uniref:hypothetical protein n=1 Tax=Methylomonas rhizoryzae TaxID=2608981 RepID=UPI0012319563|nr:hypothetical protein [Methylomonas rhizoryzae]